MGELRLSRLPGKVIFKKENHRQGEGRIQFWASEDILKVIFQLSHLIFDGAMERQAEPFLCAVHSLIP